MCTIIYTKPAGCVNGHVVTKVVEYHEELGIYCGDIRVVEEVEWERERGRGKGEERGVEVEQGRVHGRGRRHAQEHKPKPEHQRKYEEQVDKLNAGCGEDGRMEEGQAIEEHGKNIELQISQSPQGEEGRLRSPTRDRRSSQPHVNVNANISSCSGGRRYRD